jgi:hypothetical protein
VSIFGHIGSAALSLRFSPDTLLTWHWLVVVAVAVAAVCFMMPRSSATPLQVLREVLVLVPAYLLYMLVRGLVEGRQPEAIMRAMQLINLERALHIFWELDLQSRIVNIGALETFADWTYLLGMWPVIILVAMWLFFRHRDAYPLYRNAFLISGAIGLVIYATLPVAPPRFMDGWGFVDTVGGGSVYALPNLPILVNNYASVPSLHFGWIFLSGIAVFRESSGLPAKVLSVFMPLAMLFSIVATGNHFILDAVTGGIVALIGLGGSLVLRNLVMRGDEPPNQGFRALAAQMF